MNVFQKAGKMALGSRLRILGEEMIESAQAIYNVYEVELKPKWFPVFYCLSQSPERLSITEIARDIGQSHPAVIKTIKGMRAEGIVSEHRDEKDGRKNNIALTEKGKRIAQQFENQYQDVGQAVEALLSQTQHNLWLALDEFEYLLAQKPLFSSVLEQKKLRESQHVQIIDYEARYAQAFKALNEAWISKYFKMEAVDHQSLDNPKSYILDKGGLIRVALYAAEPVGVCALIKMDHERFDYELAKMAVSPQAQGKGIGYILGRDILEQARQLGARSVYLESNTVLEPAIKLYQKLGFQKVVGYPSPYERCNIQMEVRVA